MNERTITLKDGEVELRKPTAGIRNNAMMKAEGKDGIKQTVMMVELLPLCVFKHPWGVKPIRTALNDLDYDEYDLLIDKLREVMDISGELKKKLKSESDPETKAENGTSELKSPT
jgi:hypothetical protein